MSIQYSEYERSYEHDTYMGRTGRLANFFWETVSRGRGGIVNGALRLLFKRNTAAINMTTGMVASIAQLLFDAVF